MTRRWQLAVDAFLALLVLVTGLAEVWVPFESREGTGSQAATTVQVVIVSVALLVRSTNPLVCLAVIGAAFVGFDALGLSYLLFNGQFVPLVLATFAVARHTTGRTPYLGGGLVVALMLTADLTIEELQSPSELIFHWIVLAVTYALGTWQRVTGEREREARRRAVEAEVRAAEAVAEERIRIARELHDVVAHAMSVIVVQAAATELVADEPTRVRDALGSIRRTGSEALDEMRRLVSMLRDSDEPPSRQPQPSLAAIGDLVGEARDGGLPVSIGVTGEERSLPAGLDLAAYRVVQEALTNVRRHAGRVTEVRVGLDFAPDQLHIEVTDDGAGAAGSTGSGHGLIGMGERVALYGGRLEVGPREPRGFAVRAVLPLEPA